MDVEKKYKIIKDILLLFGLFIVIFLSLSIYSYSADDPSFSNIVFSNYESLVSNIFGKLGAFVADMFGTIFGCIALLIPFFALFSTWEFNKFRKESDEKVYKSILSILFGIILLFLLSLLAGFISDTDFYFAGKSGGGIIGLLSIDFLSPLLGVVGGVLLTIFAIIVAGMLLFRVSIFDIPVLIQIDLSRFKRNKDNSDSPIEVKKEKRKYNKKEIKKTKELLDDYESVSPSTDNTSVKEIVENENIKGLKYKIPLSLLKESESDIIRESEQELRVKAKLLEQKLSDFGVTGKIKDIQPGPVVTQFEFEPTPGIKVNKISNLENDLALAMSALSVRIIAPIPGKSVVGIELPNKARAVVSLKDMISTKQFAEYKSFLAFAMGKDIAGRPYITDIGKMPHLLIAGTTGSGKSVSVNTMICSIIYKSSPEDVKFVMIDPKMVELSVYEGIPHLAAPVVTDPRKASLVLKNVVTEMEERYQLLAEHKVRNIDSFNSLAKKSAELNKLPYLVVIVDEFADLMIVAGKEVEHSIIRIAQMARAVGIHLILATQRPSVNVITGIIKANMPSRLSFRVSSKIDSRTILDQNGAELLLGRGDSLFVPPGASDTTRVHGCFVDEEEVGRIVEYVKSLGEPEYNVELMKEESKALNGIDESEIDEKYNEALEFIRSKDQASISMIQRYLRIGYNRAARIIEIMEQQGIIGPSDGTSRAREVLIKE